MHYLTNSGLFKTKPVSFSGVTAEVSAHLLLLKVRKCRKTEGTATTQQFPLVTSPGADELHVA